MPSIRSKGLRALACGLFYLQAGTVAAAAQETVRGRVADADERPLAGAVILLHAVIGESGTELARDTAGADGTFDLSYEFSEGPLYFVATRIDDAIYMAEPFREHPTEPIVLRAGEGVEPLRIGGLGSPAGAPQSAAAPQRASDHGGWWVAAIGAAIVGAVFWVVHRNRRRAPRARELMAQIARLDETREATKGAASDDGYRARREELRARLIEALELDPDAARH